MMWYTQSNLLLLIYIYTVQMICWRHCVSMGYQECMYNNPSHLLEMDIYTQSVIHWAQLQWCIWCMLIIDIEKSLVIMFCTIANYAFVKRVTGCLSNQYHNKNVQINSALLNQNSSLSCMLVHNTVCLLYYEFDLISCCLPWCHYWSITSWKWALPSWEIG